MGLLSERICLRAEMDPERALAALRTNTSTDVLTERPKPLIGRLEVNGEHFQITPLRRALCSRSLAAVMKIQGSLRRDGTGSLIEIRMRPFVPMWIRIVLTCLIWWIVLSIIEIPSGLWMQEHPVWYCAVCLAVSGYTLFCGVIRLWGKMGSAKETLCTIWQASPIKK